MGDYRDKIQCPQGLYNPVEKISTTYINQDHILIYPSIENLLRTYSNTVLNIKELIV